MTELAWVSALDQAVTGHMVRLSHLTREERAREVEAMDEATFAKIGLLLAAAAFEPGGVSMLGKHWCAAS